MKGGSMSEDLTRKLPKSDNGEIVLILRNIDSRLHSLEQKVEERLYDTRPIWEKVVVDVARLQTDVTRIEETMTSEFREVKTSIREIFFQIGAMSETMVAIQGNIRYIDSRVRDLEQRQQNPTNSQT
jgi:hypothetical protein